MVEIGETFMRFQRLVRDASQELGKSISLTIDGAETELDKSVVERISEPLTHLVRNAVDHGIETAEQSRQRDHVGQHVNALAPPRWRRIPRGRGGGKLVFRHLIELQAARNKRKQLSKSYYRGTRSGTA